MNGRINIVTHEDFDVEREIAYCAPRNRMTEDELIAALLDQARRFGDVEPTNNGIDVYIGAHTFWAVLNLVR